MENASYRAYCTVQYTSASITLLSLPSDFLKINKKKKKKFLAYLFNIICKKLLNSRGCGDCGLILELGQKYPPLKFVTYLSKVSKIYEKCFDPVTASLLVYF
jgi:hypothetical protein